MVKNKKYRKKMVQKMNLYYKIIVKWQRIKA